MKFKIGESRLFNKFHSQWIIFSSLGQPVRVINLRDFRCDEFSTSNSEFGRIEIYADRTRSRGDATLGFLFVHDVCRSRLQAKVNRSVETRTTHA